MCCSFHLKSFLLPQQRLPIRPNYEQIFSTVNNWTLSVELGISFQGLVLHLTAVPGVKGMGTSANTAGAGTR